MPRSELPLSILMLYRQRLPAAAPQAVQWLSTAHALACAGAEVVLVADRPLEAGEGTPPPALSDVLQAYELSPQPRLQLHWLTSRNKLAAGLEYRWQVLQWLRRASALGRVPILYARRPDYARFWIELRQLAVNPLMLVYEWHYLGSANRREQGQTEEAQHLAQLEAQLLQLAEGHVVVSPVLAQALSHETSSEAPAELRALLPGTTEKPLLYLPNGGPQPLAAAYETQERQPNLLVYAGLFRRVQDFELLLQALRQLDPHVKLSVLGSDEQGTRLAQVSARVESLGLRERVQFMGYRSPQQTRAILRAAHLAIASFADTINMRYFACPLKLLEYQAAGVPFICTDHPTTRALVQADEACLLVPPDDPSALAVAVQKLSKDHDLQQRFRMRGLEQAQQRSWQQRGIRLYEFLQRLANERYVRRLS